MREKVFRRSRKKSLVVRFFYADGLQGFMGLAVGFNQQAKQRAQNQEGNEETGHVTDIAKSVPIP